MRTLIIFGTSEGHTRKVAGFIADRLRDGGHDVDERNASMLTEALTVEEYDAVIVGSSVHAGKFQPSVAEWVRAHSVALQGVPSAFFSVSLTAAYPDDEHRKIAEQTARDFLCETGWSPHQIWYVAGALLYRQYPAPKRFIMKQVLKREGGETDTSRDHEYTDWHGLERDVDGFVENVMLEEMEAML